MNFFEIDFFEVGEKGSGDAISIRYADDDGKQHIHVVDGGYQKDGKIVSDHINKYYENPGYIENVILTHPDGDHAGGLKSLLTEFGIGTLWMNRPWEHIDALIPRFDYKYTKTGLSQRLRKDFPHTAELEKIANDSDILIGNVFQGQKIGVFTVLAPSQERYLDLIVESEKTPEPQRKALIEGTVFERAIKAFKSAIAEWGQENLKGETDGTSPENDSSIVQYAELCGNRVLLTGDVGVGGLEEAHEYITKNLGVQLPGLDYFDVPHHGSRRNLSSDVLDKWLGPKHSVQPSETNFTAVVMANRNDAEHPKKAVRRALAHRGGRVLQPKGTLHCSQNAADRGWTPAVALVYPEDMEE